MMKELQDFVAVAVHLALASTLGLNIAIAAAGFASSKIPMGCKACTEGMSISTLSRPPVAIVALAKPRSL
jgi:hypothetical protein